jgi:hypothetical protein
MFYGKTHFWDNGCLQLQETSVNFVEIENFFSRLKLHRCFKTRFFDISPHNLLISGVAFGNKAGKLGTHSYECKMLLLFIL